MAQPLFSGNCSGLRLHGLRSSDLIRTTAPHLRRAIVPARPLRRSQVLAAAEAGIANEMAATNKDDDEEEEVKSISTTGGDSLAQDNTAPNLQISPQSNKPSWDKVLLGTILVFSVALFRQALKLREMAREVDSVVEVVEVMAAGAKKAAEEVAESLPDGKLKETAVKLKKIASLVDKRAAFADSFLDQVDDVVEGLDGKLQPVNKGTKSNDAAAANVAARNGGKQ